MGRRSQAAEEDLQDADTVETAAPVVPGARGDARWRPAPALPDGTCAGSVLLALRKHKSAARCVGRAALAPHRAPGARAVRLICFSCGRTRPATICQAPRRLAARGWQGQEAAARPVPLELERRRRVGVARGTRRDRTARAPRSRSRCSRRPHLSACAESVRGYAGRDAQAERELREGAARPQRDRAGVFVRRRARCRRWAA